MTCWLRASTVIVCPTGSISSKPSDVPAIQLRISSQAGARGLLSELLEDQVEDLDDALAIALSLKPPLTTAAGTVDFTPMPATLTQNSSDASEDGNEPGSGDPAGVAGPDAAVSVGMGVGADDWVAVERQLLGVAGTVAAAAAAGVRPPQGLLQRCACIAVTAVAMAQLQRGAAVGKEADGVAAAVHGMGGGRVERSGRGPSRVDGESDGSGRGSLLAAACKQVVWCRG